jgi:hypothetical protein
MATATTHPHSALRMVVIEWAALIRVKISAHPPIRVPAATRTWFQLIRRGSASSGMLMWAACAVLVRS